MSTSADADLLAHLALSAPQVATGCGEVTVGGADTPWAEAAWLAFDAVCDSDRIAAVELRFHDRAGGDEPAVRILLGLFPGLPARLAVPLTALDGQNIFLPRTPGRLKAFTASRRLAPSAIGRVALALADHAAPQAVAVSGAVLLRREPDYPVPALPLVDALGQWRARTWPGKTGDAAELREALRREAAAMAGAAYPAGWSRWGGDQAQRLPATGFFRTHHDGRRWWLADPDGCAFWSAGLDCVNPGEPTALLPGMERLVEALPPTDGVWAEAGIHTTNHRGQRQVNFATANLVRAFGPGWRQAWTDLTAGRLRAWRFTTVANWSDQTFARGSGLPYVIAMPAYPATPRRLFRDLSDVFDPAFATAAGEWARHLERYHDDPALLGYFMANEPHWAFGRFNLASEMLEQHPGSHSRRALAAWLRERYAGDAAVWAAAWGGRVRAFDDVIDGIFPRLEDASRAAHDDLWEFSKVLADRALRIPTAACRSVDRQHLNLGLRFAWVSSDLCYAGADAVDVFTINCYQMLPPAEQITEIAARTGRPVLIGEYHWGALDRGMPATGLKAVASQGERGVAYRRYTEAAMAHPACIGAHYFTLNDQAVLGRFDGENFQIGLVDGCHRPYAEMVAAVTACHDGMHAVVRGERPAWSRDAVETPRVGF